LSRILVIRLGALGDFVQSFGPFAAIRAHHADARITLLTTEPFADLARRAPWFDEVVIDARPRWWDLVGILRLRSRLRGFDFVHDLQTSVRSSRYFYLAGRPPWSGIARGASHPHANPLRDLMHTRERQREQLEAAGVLAFPAPDLSWFPPGPDLPLPFALLVPGAAPHRPKKRWPVEHYGALAAILAARGLTPVVIGTAAEAPLAAAIAEICPQVLDLTGKTEVSEIFGIASRAALAVGNDTGPMHLATASGCPCVVLFSADSDPALTSPRGPDGVWPALLRVPDLAELPVAEVAELICSLDEAKRNPGNA
jgi:ADP-heptose:LPS heptosyltransferase